MKLILNFKAISMNHFMPIYMCYDYWKYFNKPVLKEIVKNVGDFQHHQY